MIVSGKPLSVFVIGTRAQLIKVAPVIVACEQRGLPVRLLMTGQHKETMQDLVEEFGIVSPQEVAVVAAERSTVFSLLAWVPRALHGLVKKLRPLTDGGAASRVIVHGDTMSAVLGAIAARRCGISVVHLESGLTSHRLFDPFPEEMARRIVFRLTDLALCPSPESAEHMRRSGYRCKVVDTGENTIVDSVMIATRSTPTLSVDVDAPPYLVASLHRFQNIFDRKRLQFLVSLLGEVSQRFRIHFVLHPATRKRLEAQGLLAELARYPNINLSPRLGYAEFLRLAAGAACVLTDGGSNQEELAVLGVPTIVMRQATERLDGLGSNALMEADVGSSLAEYVLSDGFNALRRPSRVKNSMGPSNLVADLLAT